MEIDRRQENSNSAVLTHLREYAGSKQFLGYAFSTQDLYILDLTRFQNFCERNQGELNEKLVTFMESLSAGAGNRAFSALRGFFNWAQAETLVAPSENPFAKFDKGKKRQLFESLNS